MAARGGSGGVAARMQAGAPGRAGTGGGGTCVYRSRDVLATVFVAAAGVLYGPWVTGAALAGLSTRMIAVMVFAPGLGRLRHRPEGDGHGLRGRPDPPAAASGLRRARLGFWGTCAGDRDHHAGHGQQHDAGDPGLRDSSLVARSRPPGTCWPGHRAPDGRPAPGQRRESSELAALGHIRCAASRLVLLNLVRQRAGRRADLRHGAPLCA